MNNDNPQLMKELQHPTSKYDYDGITGTWLLIPAKFHILMLAIALPVILWMFPFIHLKGNYRYIFADYRYYIAGAVTIFCLASTFLSILKAKQVRHRIRPISDVSRQSVTKSKNSRPKKVANLEKKPKINLGHIKKSQSAATANNTKDSATSSSKSNNKFAEVISKGVTKTAEKKELSSQKNISQEKTHSRSNAKPPKNKELDLKTTQKSTPKASTPKRKKNPKQMQLDL